MQEYENKFKREINAREAETEEGVTEGEIPGQVKMLEINVKELSKALEYLNQRINPVLSYSEPEDDTGDAALSASSRLGALLQEQNEIIEMLLHKVQRLASRVQL